MWTAASIAYRIVRGIVNKQSEGKISKYNGLKTYCPRCQEVYVPRQKHLDIDGAYFGTSFSHVLLKVILRDLAVIVVSWFVPKGRACIIYSNNLWL